jgi:hypothetical protein
VEPKRGLCSELGQERRSGRRASGQFIGLRAVNLPFQMGVHVLLQCYGTGAAQADFDRAAGSLVRGLTTCCVGIDNVAEFAFQMSSECAGVRLDRVNPTFARR